jgi:hypothetical protein
MQVADHSILRMIRALTIPCRAITLLLIAIFASLVWLGLRGGAVGIPLIAIITSWVFKYAFALLDRVAEGGREPPVLAYEMLHPLTEQRPLATLGLLLLLLVASYWLEQWTGAQGGTVVRVLILICVPAIIAVQGMSGSFMSALDPSAWLKLMLRLRVNYVFILIVAATFWLLARSIAPRTFDTTSLLGVSLPIAYIARIAILMYGWLALHAFIGATLFERRVDIGFEPNHSPEWVAAREQRERDKDTDLLVDRIFAQWRGGAHGNAWKTVEAHLQRSPDRMTELRMLFERIARWPDVRLGHLLANELLPNLLAGNRPGEALNIVRGRLQVDPEFRPLRGEDAIRMAELARDGGDRRTARLLLKDFSERYPAHPGGEIAARMQSELARS